MKKKTIGFLGVLAISIGILIMYHFINIQEIELSKLFGLLTGILFISLGVSLFNRNDKLIFNISRIFVGLIFIYSGFVKAVDPLGSKYKFIDYFEAWHIEFIAPTALTLGIILSTIEFIVGIALVCKIFPKKASILGFLFMGIFTPITFYLAMQQNVTGKELVHDCGCFGDALILTNWQTFIKNIFLLVPSIILFYYRGKISNEFSKKISVSIILFFTISILGLSIYALKHLPPIDFRPYKIGTKLVCKSCSDIQENSNIKTYQYADFKNLKTGEHKEFEITENYPDYTIWEYNSSIPIREEKVELYKPKNNSITSKTFELNELFFTKNGEDYTCKIINDTNYVLLLVQYKLESTSFSNQQAINELYNWATKKNIAMYSATSSVDEVIDNYRKKSKAEYPFVNSDDISLKTIVRANPGLVLLKHGIVLNNWHGNDIPSIKEFEKIMKLK